MIILYFRRKDTNKRAISQIYLRKSEREYLKPQVKDTNKRAKYQILEQRMQRYACIIFAES